MKGLADCDLEVVTTAPPEDARSAYANHPEGGALLKYLKTLEDFARCFPGFEHRIHGIEKRTGEYVMYCIKDGQGLSAFLAWKGTAPGPGDRRGPLFKVPNCPEEIKEPSSGAIPYLLPGTVRNADISGIPWPSCLRSLRKILREGSAG